MNDYDNDCWHDWCDIVTCPECDALIGEFCTECGADTTPDHLAGNVGEHKPGCPRAKGTAP